jgi:hypothetical protein
VKRRLSSVLGLAVSEQGVLCAQVSPSQKSVERLGVFSLPEGATFDQPAAAGAALKDFLSQHHFGATRAVVGVPARWLIAQSQDVPPVSDEEAKSILRLQTERMGSAEKGGLVADAAGKLSGGSVLIVAMLQKRLDQIKAMTEAAGLQLAGVTSTGLAVSQLASPASHALVLVGERGAELVVRREGAARLLRHVGGAKSSSTAALAPEVRRSLMSASAADQPLVVCDATGGNCDALEQSFGVTAARPTLQQFSATAAPEALNGAAAGLTAGNFLPAVALGLAGTTLPVDFLKSRLAPAPVKRFGPRTVAGALLGVAAVAGLYLFYSTVTQAESDAADLSKLVADQKPAVASAATLIDRVNFGRTFFETRTPVLDCLAELSKAFNYDETIFLSSYNFSAAGTGEIKGKAAQDKFVFQLVERLRANKNFSNIERTDLRQSNEKTQEYSFTIRFRFSPQEGRK